MIGHPNQPGQVFVNPNHQAGVSLTPVAFEQRTSLAILRDRILANNMALSEIREALLDTRSKVMGETEPPFEVQQRITSSCAVGEIEGALNAQEDIVAAIRTHVEALQRL